MTAKTENANVLPSLPLRPVSQIQFYRLMVPFRVDGHIYHTVVHSILIIVIYLVANNSWCAV